MAMSMGKKIQRAAIEGRLFSVARKYLTIKLDYSLGKLYRYLWTKRMKVNPKQIMFISFQGDYTCNPKYIAEELRRRNLDYEIVCSSRKASLYDETFPEEFRLVEQYTVDYYRELGRSKLVIANSVEFQKKMSAKKKEQCWIETWHGSLGIKRFDASSNNGKEWVAAAKRVGKLSDYIISNSKFENEVYRGSFWPKTQILEYGHPRNDILFNQTDEKRAEVLQKVFPPSEETDEQMQKAAQVDPNQQNETDPIPQEAEEAEINYRYVLYAPTFRDSHSLTPYAVDYERLCAAMSQKFGGEWKVIVRLHPTVRKKTKKLKRSKNVINLSSYPDIQELMLIADAAITDYSSWIYDFMLTRKPGFIFATDIESYNQERGFYYPLSSTPFPIARDNDELENNILNFDDALYRSRLEEFLKDKGCFEDGNAAKRVVDLIEKIMG